MAAARLDILSETGLCSTGTASRHVDDSYRDRNKHPASSLPPEGVDG